MSAREDNGGVLLRGLPVLLGALLVALFLRLGQWQSDRAAFKDALFARFDAGQTRTPVVLERWRELAPYSPVRLAGRLDLDTRIYLENRVHAGREGVHLYVPFEPAGGGPALLANLGWQALGPGRSLPPPPALDTSAPLEGLLAPPPAAGLKLGELGLEEQRSPFRVIWMDVPALARRLNSPLAPQILLATAPRADLVRAWRPTTLSADRHRGYAFQWRALAAVVAGLTAWGLLRWVRPYRGRQETTP